MLSGLMVEQGKSNGNKILIQEAIHRCKPLGKPNLSVLAGRLEQTKRKEYVPENACSS